MKIKIPSIYLPVTKKLAKRAQSRRAIKFHLYCIAGKQSVIPANSGSRILTILLLKIYF